MVQNFTNCIANPQGHFRLTQPACLVLWPVWQQIDKLSACLLARARALGLAARVVRCTWRAAFRRRVDGLAARTSAGGGWALCLPGHGQQAPATACGWQVVGGLVHVEQVGHLDAVLRGQDHVAGQGEQASGVVGEALHDDDGSHVAVHHRLVVARQVGGEQVQAGVGQVHEAAVKLPCGKSEGRAQHSK